MRPAVRAAVLSAPFNPISLLPAAWYDPSDLSTLFQDTAGTSPVTATGQSVALIKDKSGNGLHLSQATSGKRPTYQVDANGKPYLNFDGSNDDLLSSSAISGNAQTLAVAALITANGFMMCSTVSSSDRISSRPSTSANNSIISYYNGTSATGKSTTGINTAQVFYGTVDKTTPAVTCRLNGVDGSGTSSNTPSSTVGTALGSDTAGASSFIAAQFYGGVWVARALTSSERANLERWLADKCGVSL
jgi:hypothetical protein